MQPNVATQTLHDTEMLCLKFRISAEYFDVVSLSKYSESQFRHTIKSSVSISFDTIEIISLDIIYVLL